MKGIKIAKNATKKKGLWRYKSSEKYAEATNNWDGKRFNQQSQTSWSGSALEYHTTRLVDFFDLNLNIYVFQSS